VRLGDRDATPPPAPLDAGRWRVRQRRKTNQHVAAEIKRHRAAKKAG